jgi:hypothetical protein
MSKPERLADLLPDVIAQLAARHQRKERAMATDPLTQAANEIFEEAQRAMSKFAEFNSSHEGYAVILEELDELWDDVKANRIEQSVAEAIQVGAMALRYVVEMRAMVATGRAA